MTFKTPILAWLVVPHKLLVEFILVVDEGDGRWQAVQIEVPATHELLAAIATDAAHLFSIKDLRGMLQTYAGSAHRITRARATAIFPCFDQTKCTN